MTKLLYCFNDGSPILVDDGDYVNCQTQNWRMSANGYAYNGIGQPLHTFILGASPANLEVDHRNRNKLDNTRKNLRLVTHAVNSANGPSVWNTDRCIEKHGDRWRVKYTRNTVVYRVGSYSSIEEARVARDRWLEENFPETVFMQSSQ